MEGFRVSLSAYITTLILAGIPAISAQAAPPANEAYYSQNIDDAVAAAKRNPVNTDYVGASWYNRTTSRSFPLPKMLNTEMDGEVVEGAMGPTAAGEAAAFDAAKPVRDAALGLQSRRERLSESKKKSDNPDEEEEYKENENIIYVQEARGNGSVVREIRGTVTIKATSRP